MTVSSRLALAMGLLVVATSCVVSAITYYLVAEAPRAALMTIASVALGGGAVAAVLAIGITKSWLKPLRDFTGAAEAADVRTVTEQKRAYQALIDSEQMAQSIVNTALDAFVQTDQDGVVLEWSPQAEALNGWSRQEAVGKKVTDLVFPTSLRNAHRQRIAMFLAAAAAGDTGIRYESPVLRKDGHEILVEVSLTALRRALAWRGGRAIAISG